MTLIPAKNMSKKPFFRRKNERITHVGGAGLREHEVRSNPVTTIA